MTKEKQISEMAKIVCPLNASGICECDGKPCNLACAEGKAMARLYTAGYRKATEVAREIFEEIEEYIMLEFNEEAYAELKKKYTKQE